MRKQAKKVTVTVMDLLQELREHQTECVTNWQHNDKRLRSIEKQTKKTSEELAKLSGMLEGIIRTGSIGRGNAQAPISPKIDNAGAGVSISIKGRGAWIGIGIAILALIIGVGLVATQQEAAVVQEIIGKK